MNNDRQQIFRKVMIDRLSSPDELTEVLYITRRADWLILVAVGLVITTGLLWGSVATLPVTVAGLGIGHARDKQEQSKAGNEKAVLPSIAFASDNRTDVILLVPENVADQIHPGLEVRIMPEGYAVQQYGVLNGRVSAVNTSPVDNAALANWFGNEDLIQKCATRHLRIEVHVRLQQDPGAPNEWKWTSGYSLPASSLAGAVVDGEIVLRKVRPVQWLLPWVR